jgi:hypothetical protein
MEGEGDAEEAVDATAWTPEQQVLPAAGDGEEEVDDEELARRLQREMDEEALRALYAAQFSECYLRRLLLSSVTFTV